MCGTVIKPGEKAVYLSERQPVFDRSDDIQTGIEYVTGYRHHQNGCDREFEFQVRGKVVSVPMINLILLDLFEPSAAIGREGYVASDWHQLFANIHNGNVQYYLNYDEEDDY